MRKPGLCTSAPGADKWLPEAENSNCGFLVQKSPAEIRPMLLLGHIFFVPDQILIGRGGEPSQRTRRRESTAAGESQEVRMKRTLIAGAFALAATGQTFAADLPPAAPPPPRAPAAYVPYIAPVYNWGGIYIGINGGGGFGGSNWADPNNGLATSSGNFSTDGFLIGGTVGANFQANQFVFGIEADWDYNTIKGTVTPTNGFCTNVNAAGQASTGCETTSDWLATVRGRVGYAFDRLLVFGTGGLAVANVQNGLTGGAVSPVNFDSNVKLGWTAGAGIEYAFADNWTVRADYLFVDLQNGACTSTANCGFDVGAVAPNDSVRYFANVFRAGVNFKFGGF
jgi:outer membrane immunogenic protein